MLASDGFSIVRSTQFSVVIFSGFIPGYIFSGFFLDLIGRKYWLMICLTGVAVSGTLFGFADTPAGLMVCAWFSAYFLGNGSTAIYTYTPELYPTEIRATAMGFGSAWGRAGGIALLCSCSRIFSVPAGGDWRCSWSATDCCFPAWRSSGSWGPARAGGRLEATSSAIREQPVLSPATAQ